MEGDIGRRGQRRCTGMVHRREPVARSPHPGRRDPRRPTEGSRRSRTGVRRRLVQRLRRLHRSPRMCACPHVCIFERPTAGGRLRHRLPQWSGGVPIPLSWLKVNHSGTPPRGTRRRRPGPMSTMMSALSGLARTVTHGRTWPRENQRQPHPSCANSDPRQGIPPGGPFGRLRPPISGTPATDEVERQTSISARSGTRSRAHVTQPSVTDHFLARRTSLWR